MKRPDYPKARTMKKCALSVYYSRRFLIKTSLIPTSKPAPLWRTKWVSPLAPISPSCLFVPYPQFEFTNFSAGNNGVFEACLKAGVGRKWVKHTERCSPGNPGARASLPIVGGVRREEISLESNCLIVQCLPFIASVTFKWKSIQDQSFIARQNKLSRCADLWGSACQPALVLNCCWSHSRGCWCIALSKMGGSDNFMHLFFQLCGGVCVCVFKVDSIRLLDQK